MTAFGSLIRAAKFFQPQVDTAQFLYRGRLVESLLRHNTPDNAHIVVEAQPGLGKTTIIKQYLDRIKIASAWYRVGDEDADPGFFLQAVAACINTVLADCPSTATARILTSSDLNPFDVPRRLDLLLYDLHVCLQDELCLVFDDLHHLLPHSASLGAFNALLESAPTKLRFVLISREPLSGLAHLGRTPNLLRLGNRDLAMDEHEVTDFFHQILHLAVPLYLIREVTRITGGWVMGVRLLGLHMEQRRGQTTLPTPIARNSDDGQRQLLEYFGREIFTLLEASLQRPLLILSLLDEIPVELAVELTGRPDIGSVLSDLVRRNLFIRPLDPKHPGFGLHHLFRQFLRDKAGQELDRETVAQVYRQAGIFYLCREDPAPALHYFVLAEDYRRLETVLEQTGMALLAANRATTLATLLSRIPEPRLHELGWASFFLALAHLDGAPMRALPLLDRALAIFTAHHDEVGELLSLTHLISVRIVTTGHYRGGEALLHRAVQLFSLVADSLDPATTILVARNLAMGFCIFLADIDEATRYGSLALTLARKEHLVNFEAALLMVMGYIRIFAGHTALARMYLEQAAPLVHHAEVGTFNRLAIRMMLFNFLFHDGDFPNYFDQKQQLVDLFGISLVSQSIAGPFGYIWEMDIALNRGEAAVALTLAEQALAQHPPFSPHLASQILQLQGVALAVQGRHQQALAAADESRRLRELAGGRYFITLNKLLVGLVHVLGGRHRQGLALLDEGIADARRMPTEYLEACGLLHRADALLLTGQSLPARQDIDAGLRLLARNGYRHFWGWTPAAMTRMLSLAAQHRIEPGLAQTLATERLNLALLDDGTAIPLLDIQTLGRFNILHQGRPLLEAEDLTPLQRELLALLLAAPGLKMPQETLCLHFWPDSPPATMKIKFDTLVSRLRKTLAGALPKNTAPLYFNRGKGMLWLAHCRDDAHQFLDGVKRGMNHYRLQEFWQAGNAFTAAEPLWQGEFAPGVAGDDRIRLFRDTLVRSLAEWAVAWSDLLVRSDRLPAAIRVVDKAVLYDPLNDRLHARLYRLEGQRSAMHARRVLQRFETILRQEGYHDREIADLVLAITTPQPPGPPFPT